jgi:membrane associated rhomboid family serine protease
MSVQESNASAPTRSVWKPVVVLLAIMWAVELVDLVLPWSPDGWGIQSRTVPGLLGIPLSPFLHDGLDHLAANTVPLLILGLLVSWRAGSSFWPVVVTIVLVGGAGVWLLGPSDAVTIGASGLVLGLLTYLLAAGIVTRRWGDVALSVVVLLLYGGMLTSTLPFAVAPGVSWLGHLAGAAGGVVAALLFAARR